MVNGFIIPLMGMGWLPLFALKLDGFCLRTDLCAQRDLRQKRQWGAFFIVVYLARRSQVVYWPMPLT